MPKKEVGTGVSSQFSPDEAGFAKSRKSRDDAESRLVGTRFRKRAIYGWKLVNAGNAFEFVNPSPLEGLFC